LWLENRNVLITGGSRGIGRATALRLAAHRPAHVAIGYVLDHDAARSAVAEIEALGVAASAHCADVSRDDALAELFEQVARICPTLDVFIGNAARAWQRMMDLNARAFLLGSQHAAALMPGGGRILALSSLGSRFYTRDYGALGAAKAALESLVRYLAVELAPRNINVNAVCGGFVDTESTRLHPDVAQISAAIAARTPAGRVGKPEDIAAVLSFLCTQDADWIRGQTLVADGGFSLGLG